MLNRYARDQMVRIWSPRRKYEVWRKIEVLALEAHAELGTIPSDVVKNVRSRSEFPIDDAFIKRVDEIESVVHHDVIAFVTALAERIGEHGRFVHHGLTSYDVVDTALSVLLKEALELIVSGLDELSAAVNALADEHRYTVMAGRTHGVHAEPITLGFKLAGWYSELVRDRQRLVEAVKSVTVGKLSGAVGTFAHTDPFVEEYVCARLGLVAAPISTQVLGRDRHAEALCVLAIIAGTLDRFAVEIRSLQRTEIGEAAEPFASGQKGSSAMPHKKNPIICERISGLARIVKANASVALDNMGLWHERDISNSAPERMIIPSSTTLVEYMLVMMTRVIVGLQVNEDRMRENLDASGGVIFSQRVMLALVEEGLSREEAYRIVQGCALNAVEGKGGFRTLISEHEEVRRLLSAGRLERCFSLEPYVKNVDLLLDRAGIRRQREEQSEL